ncbi:MAG: BrnT family toxin [Sedimenticola sp.]
MITFEWHEAKNTANQRKHGISFAEAKSVFFDEYAVQFYDEDHSSHEDRFVMLGTSNQSRILIVCHCERNSGETIRIISARKATKKERSYYPRGAS